MENVVLNLFKTCFGYEAVHTQLLPQSGSARRYYRIFAGKHTFIGTYNENVEENRLFIRFSRHFKQQKLHVPEIYTVAEDERTYIQEDLGDRMLLTVVEEERKRGLWNERLTRLYKKSLAELVRFQLLGGEGLDYSCCSPRPAFDRRCMLWDLNYFKYCFLRLAGVGFSEELLENDFEKLTDTLCTFTADGFMFRDFQSRNIMVCQEEVWFIDYQGGRQGALQYDVASLLYDAIVGIPGEERMELLDYYIGELQRYRKIDPVCFREGYYRFALIRLLQAMGAFGLRGLYERKQHFIDSVLPGLRNIILLFEEGKLDEDYPEIHRVTKNCLEMLSPQEDKACDSHLQI